MVLVIDTNKVLVVVLLIGLVYVVHKYQDEIKVKAKKFIISKDDKEDDKDDKEDKDKSKSKKKRESKESKDSKVVKKESKENKEVKDNKVKKENKVKKVNNKKLEDDILTENMSQVSMGSLGDIKGLVNNDYKRDSAFDTESCNTLNVLNSGDTNDSL